MNSDTSPLSASPVAFAPDPMTAIARHRLDRGAIDREFWPAAARAASDWLVAHDAALRDAIVLLPHAALLAPARAAFARGGGWQPRIETAHTLAASLGPPTLSGATGPSGDASIDRPAAAALLRRHAPAWMQGQPQALASAALALADTANALLRAAAAHAPDLRAAWWQDLREALPPLAGPGAAERLIARIALEWAAAADAPATDALWTLRASAWVGLCVATPDALIAGLLARAERALWLDADPPSERPFDAAASLSAPRCERAVGLEDEAQAATLAVHDALARGLAPVALIAQDRRVVRRIRALLERSGVALADETGWTLSTTRAGTALMALLRAAQPGAGRDALVEALKTEAPAAATQLEQAWRLEREPAPAALAPLQQLRERLDLLRGAGPHSLADRLASLPAAAPGLMRALADDSAGRQLLAALHLDGLPGTPAWQPMAAATRLDHAGFIAWVDDALEASTYRPSAPPDAAVVITPLTQAALRPFGAVVFPGCNERHLGARHASPTLLPQAVACRFGLPEAGLALTRETLAFATLLRAPNLHLLRSTHDDDEALAASPLWQRAALARRRLGTAPFEERAFNAPQGQVVRRPLGRPSPSMAQALPSRVSAATVEALRECPYRFFARTGLHLAEATELDAALDKSDHGRWLHAVLHRFHRQRGSDDHAALLAAADDETTQLGLDRASLLPFRAGFEAFAGHYLEWLRRHEEQGWRYAGGELARRCVAPDLGGVALEGRLDRIDVHAEHGGALVIDYKSGNADKLSQRIKTTPLEDTQLAFYAALLTEEASDPPPRAIYLALDESAAPRPIEHHDVARSASALVEGLAADLQALRDGAGATALGEGEACRHCAARGLCRRDHWTRA
jgi:ATP-dependent helicase/nuclease subunit B